MKKLLLILPLLISCSAEKETCNCKTAKMTTFENIGSYFYIENMPIDCETGQPDLTGLPSNYRFVKCVE